MFEDAIDFAQRRGGTKDARSPNEKPYSAASYAAQYGVPLEDCQDMVKQYTTHGEVRQRIYREFLSSEDFEEAALSHQTRPEGEMTEAEKLLDDIQKTGEEDVPRYTVLAKQQESARYMPEPDAISIEAEKMG